MNDTLTSIEGLAVGHWQHIEARTGCTVVLCPPEGCVASGLAFGSAPGSREYALLSPEKTVDKVHAVLLTGGSAFGLNAATGVMQWLEQQGRGLATPFGVVPIVPAAVIFDLGNGRSDIRPDASAGYEAASSATTEPVKMGSLGVGTGALVGKYLGFEHASKGGLGTAVIEVQGAKVAALAVSNAVGDLIDPDTGKVVAGSKANQGVTGRARFESILSLAGTNTTLVLVATDVPLSKAQAHQLAQAAHIGIARVTRPSHTVHDGDTAFVLSTGRGPAVSQLVLSVAVQEVVAEALLKGAIAANN